MKCDIASVDSGWPDVVYCASTMKKYVVCKAASSSRVDVVGSYDDAGEAARACNNGGAGFHVVKDGVIIRYHSRTDKRTIEAMRRLIESGTHPAVQQDIPQSSRDDGEAAAAASPSPDLVSAPDVGNDGADDDEFDKGADDEDGRAVMGQVDKMFDAVKSSPAAVAEAARDDADGSSRCRRARQAAMYTVMGQTLPIREWSKIVGMTPEGMRVSKTKNARTWEEEIEYRLGAKELTGSAKSKTRGHQDLSQNDSDSVVSGAPVDDDRPPQRKAQRAARHAGSADGTLEDLQDILNAATRHGGIRNLISNAELGLSIRDIVMRS